MPGGKDYMQLSTESNAFFESYERPTTHQKIPRGVRTGELKQEVITHASLTFLVF